MSQAYVYGDTRKSGFKSSRAHSLFSRKKAIIVTSFQYLFAMLRDIQKSRAGNCEHFFWSSHFVRDFPSERNAKTHARDFCEAKINEACSLPAVRTRTRLKDKNKILLREIFF